jgi:multiple sugar transport system ATP-binding protein
MATVQLEHVRKVYEGGFEAVHDFNLAIKEREFIVLVGPSGCGKSTTLRMIAGLEDITSGTVAIGGKVMNKVAPKDRDIAMVFQSYALYPHMSVYDNLAFGLKLRKMGKDEIDRRVREAANILGLAEYIDKKPRALSGGQRQRVAMGRAIVREPQAFLMDEPLSNLDAKLRVQTRSEIARIQRDLGVTTIYVTHDQVEAITLGERIAVLSEGVLQQVGPPQDVYDHPANVFVAGFIGSPPMNLLKGNAAGGRIAVGEAEFVDRQVPDGEVLVGIRPEGLHPVGEAFDGPVFEVSVEVVEPLGDEVLVHGSIEAHAAEEHREAEEVALLADGKRDRATITLRLPPEERPKPGSRLRVGVAQHKVRLFDAANGLAVEPR